MSSRSSGDIDRPALVTHVLVLLHLSDPEALRVVVDEGCHVLALCRRVGFDAPRPSAPPRSMTSTSRPLG